MLQDGVTPCTVSFSAVIDACAQARNAPWAEWWMQKMRDARLRVDAVVFNSLIHACAKDENPSKAEYWLQQMQLDNLFPDEDTYNSLINAKSGRLVQLTRPSSGFFPMEQAGCKVLSRRA